MTQTTQPRPPVSVVLPADIDPCAVLDAKILSLIRARQDAARYAADARRAAGQPELDQAALRATYGRYQRALGSGPGAVVAALVAGPGVLLTRDRLRRVVAPLPADPAPAEPGADPSIRE